MKNRFSVKKDLWEKIRKIKLSQITGSYFRLVSPKREDAILSTQGSFAYGGRYNAPGDFGVLYLGDSKEVCRVERNRRTKNSSLVPQVLGEVKVSCEKVLDLTDPGICKKLGIKKEDLLRKKKEGGWDLTWDIARFAYQADIQAILAPSISGAGNNLIIFDKHLEAVKIKLKFKTKE